MGGDSHTLWYQPLRFFTISVIIGYRQVANFCWTYLFSIFCCNFIFFASTLNIDHSLMPCWQVASWSSVRNHDVWIIEQVLIVWEVHFFTRNYLLFYVDDHELYTLVFTLLCFCHSFIPWTVFLRHIWRISFVFPAVGLAVPMLSTTIEASIEYWTTFSSCLIFSVTVVVFVAVSVLDSLFILL